MDNEGYFFRFRETKFIYDNDKKNFYKLKPNLKFNPKDVKNV